MERKSIVKNYIYNLFYQIIILILPLITTPYISRTLGAEAIGIYSFTYSVATYFILFGSLGVSWYGQREIAYLQNDIEKRSKLFFEIVLMRFIMMIISVTLFYVFYVNGTEYNIYYAILLIEMFSTILDISWFFMGMEEFKKTVIRNLIVKVLFVTLIFTIVKTPSDLPKYFLIVTLSNLIGNLSLWCYLPKYIQKTKIKELNIFKHIKPTIVLFVPQIAIQIYTVLDKTMLGYVIDNKSEVGYYEQGQKIVKMLLVIVTSLGTVMLPRMANSYANNEKEVFKNSLYNSIRFVYLLAFPIMAGVLLVADTFVPFFLGPGYEKVIILVQIIVPIILFIGLTNVIGMQYFITTKQSKKLTLSVTIGAVINFLLNIVLIKNYASVGASIATVIAEGMVFIVQMYMIRKEFNIWAIIKLSKNPIISTFVMCLIAYGISNLFDERLIGMCVEIFVGIIIYFITLFILKDDFLKQLLEKVAVKIKFVDKLVKYNWK